ncbi:MAG: Flp pilus assembly complex ATPase component TadA [Candidatus Marinimicrobia bacterium]|nr:Flp pilus assembly complex ATPase component TadA [Candidatus Neomarinimicrobiota bacterium]
MEDFNPQFKRLGEILIHQGKVSEKQLNSALEEQKSSKSKLGEILINNGFLTEDELIGIYSLQLGYPQIKEEELFQADQAVVKLIPEDFARQTMVLALRKTNRSIIVAMEDPEDLAGIDALKRLTGLTPDVHVTGTSALKRAMDEIYARIKQSGEVEEVIEGITVISGDEDNWEEVDLSPDKVSAEDAPIVRLVNMILQEAISERATDIHIEPQKSKVVVRIRIDGVLQVIMTPPNSSLSGLVTRIKILSRLNIAERRLPQDGRFTIKATNHEIDVRVSILPTVFGEKIVLRLLDKTGFDFTLSTLGFDEDMYAVFRRVIKQPYGMIVVSGPTGSGKSTSLYASLKDIKNVGSNIITVEDPVEYQLDGISQVQVHEGIGLTFGTSLRSILRQDPDILLIGEIRDEETADISVKFSLTGHLVFSTVHANDAASTITRLLDIGVKPFLVGSCLNLVMAQRLVRRICPHCKEDYVPDAESLKRIGLDPARLDGGKLWRGKGCNKCRQTGYHGRTGIFEIILMTRTIRGLVFDNENEDAIRQRALEEGMVSLRESGLRKVILGKTTVAEVTRSTVEEF